MTDAKERHLHIAFAASSNGLGIVVKDEAYKVIATHHAGTEGPERFHPWQALLAALQLAVDLEATKVTLYSHHGNLANMAKLANGQSETAELAGYSAVAWGLLFGRFMGHFAFKEIDEEKNPAIAVARDDKAGIGVQRR